MRGEEEEGGLGDWGSREVSLSCARLVRTEARVRVMGSMQWEAALGRRSAYRHGMRVANRSHVLLFI